jgi:hypothetical protein
MVSTSEDSLVAVGDDDPRGLTIVSRVPVCSLIETTSPCPALAIASYYRLEPHEMDVNSLQPQTLRGHLPCLPASVIAECGTPGPKVSMR